MTVHRLEKAEQHYVFCGSVSQIENWLLIPVLNSLHAGRYTPQRLRKHRRPDEWLVMPSSRSQSTPSRDLVRAFWFLVLVFNVSLLATTIGILLIVFRNQSLFGGILIALGLAFGIVGYQRYIHYRYHHTFTHETE